MLVLAYSNIKLNFIFWKNTNLLKLIRRVSDLHRTNNNGIVVNTSVNHVNYVHKIRMHILLVIKNDGVSLLFMNYSHG